MHLYIDKENLESLVKGRNNNLDLYAEITRYVKKGLEVHYNFSKEEFLKNVYLQAWFQTVKSDGVTSSSTFCPPKEIFPEHPVKSNFLNDSPFEAYRSLYLLNMEDSISQTIKNKQCILIGNVGEEYEVMNKLQMLDDKEIPASTLKSWNQYCPQIPLTDIILCDEHYFNNKSVYEKNANEILTSLCVTPKNQINVVIITKEGQVDSNIDLEAECKNIKEQLAKVSGISKGKCKVTILTTYKTHSRHLITNYFRIIHTSCFHLKENQLKADVNTTIASDAFKNSASTTAHLIKLFQEVADAPVKSFGDKKSNFLNFSQ